MKKILVFLFSLVLILSITACESETSSGGMTLEPAPLSDEQIDILELVGSNIEVNVFGFNVDKNIKTITTRTYELKNGQWEPFSSSTNFVEKGSKGLIALNYELIPNGIEVGTQIGESVGSSTYTSEEPIDMEASGYNVTTTVLSSSRDIEYGKEIPLIIQFLTEDNSINSYEIDTFFEPELYSDYEHTYAITVEFNDPE